MESASEKGLREERTRRAAEAESPACLWADCLLPCFDTVQLSETGL